MDEQQLKQLQEMQNLVNKIAEEGSASVEDLQKLRTLANDLGLDVADPDAWQSGETNLPLNIRPSWMGTELGTGDGTGPGSYTDPFDSSPDEGLLSSGDINAIIQSILEQATGPSQLDSIRPQGQSQVIGQNVNESSLLDSFRPQGVSVAPPSARQLLEDDEEAFSTEIDPEAYLQGITDRILEGVDATSALDIFRPQGQSQVIGRNLNESSLLDSLGKTGYQAEITPEEALLLEDDGEAFTPDIDVEAILQAAEDERIRRENPEVTGEVASMLNRDFVTGPTYEEQQILADQAVSGSRRDDDADRELFDFSQYTPPAVVRKDFDYPFQLNPFESSVEAPQIGLHDALNRMGTNIDHTRQDRPETRMEWEDWIEHRDNRDLKDKSTHLIDPVEDNESTVPADPRYGWLKIAEDAQSKTDSELFRDRFGANDANIPPVDNVSSYRRRRPNTLGADGETKADEFITFPYQTEAGKAAGVDSVYADAGKSKVLSDWMMNTGKPFSRQQLQTGRNPNEPFLNRSLYGDGTDEDSPFPASSIDELLESQEYDMPFWGQLKFKDINDPLAAFQYSVGKDAENKEFRENYINQRLEDTEAGLKYPRDIAENQDAYDPEEVPGYWRFPNGQETNNPDGLTAEQLGEISQNMRHGMRETGDFKTTNIISIGDETIIPAPDINVIDPDNRATGEIEEDEEEDATTDWSNIFQDDSLSVPNTFRNVTLDDSLTQPDVLDSATFEDLYKEEPEEPEDETDRLFAYLTGAAQFPGAALDGLLWVNDLPQEAQALAMQKMGILPEDYDYMGAQGVVESLTGGNFADLNNVITDYYFDTSPEYQDRREAAQEQHPYYTMAGELTGELLTGGLAAAGKAVSKPLDKVFTKMLSKDKNPSMINPLNWTDDESTFRDMKRLWGEDYAETLSELSIPDALTTRHYGGDTAESILNHGLTDAGTLTLDLPYGSMYDNAARAALDQQRTLRGNYLRGNDMFGNREAITPSPDTDFIEQFTDPNQLNFEDVYLDGQNLFKAWQDVPLDPLDYGAIGDKLRKYLLPKHKQEGPDLDTAAFVRELYDQPTSIAYQQGDNYPLTFQEQFKIGGQDLFNNYTKPPLDPLDDIIQSISTDKQGTGGSLWESAFHTARSDFDKAMGNLLSTKRTDLTKTKDDFASAWIDQFASDSDEFRIRNKDTGEFGHSGSSISEIFDKTYNDYLTGKRNTMPNSTDLHSAFIHNTDEQRKLTAPGRVLKSSDGYPDSPVIQNSIDEFRKAIKELGDKDHRTRTGKLLGHDTGDSLTDWRPIYKDVMDTISQHSRLDIDGDTTNWLPETISQKQLDELQAIEKIIRDLMNKGE